MTFGVDLNRDRKFAQFETRATTVADDGGYELPFVLDASSVSVEFVRFVTNLLTSYQGKGFAALLDGGPLPIVVSFERQGYATVTKRLASLNSKLKMDAVMVPLAEVGCDQEICLTPDGSVRLEGIGKDMGIARAYAHAFDPALDTEQFPGAFSDADNKLLISSGFAELNVYDASGKPLTTVSSPVSVRFEMNRASWSTLPDLVANSGYIELPMYSFARATGEWVREADGELQRANGERVPESAVPAIRDGSFEDAIYVAFRTKHFSTFNCDASRERRACVKGRLTDNAGEAKSGASVKVEGVNYTGSVGLVLTGPDGLFATDVMRSEGSSEDLDGNGKRGEVFRVRVQATDGTGFFRGSVFDTPAEEHSVSNQSSDGTACMPSACECLNLGDVVADFETPRFCHVRVSVRFGGHELIASGKSPIASGEVLESAFVRAQMVGGLQNADQVCDDGGCDSGMTDADGKATLAIPIVGDAPQVQIEANFSKPGKREVHSYTGSVVVDGCSRDNASIDGEIELKTSHAALGSIADYFAALEASSSGDGGSSAATSSIACGCRVAGARLDSEHSSGVAYYAFVVAVAARSVRRRRRAR